MKSAAKKSEVAEITTTYVWRVVMRHATTKAEIGLLVLCDEQLMGEKFKKSVEDVFEACKLQGLIDWPDSTNDYTTASVENVGFAAGSVKIEKPNGVPVGNIRAGVPMMIDPDRVSMLAGLTYVHETAAAKAEDATSKKRDKDLYEMEKLVKIASNNATTKDILLDTAMTMAKEGDLDSVPSSVLEQAIAAAKIVNPNVLNPSLPSTPEEAEKLKRQIEQLFTSEIKKD